MRLQNLLEIAYFSEPKTITVFTSCNNAKLTFSVESFHAEESVICLVLLHTRYKLRCLHPAIDGVDIP